MNHQIPLDDSARADQAAEDGLHAVTHDVAYLRLVIVNVVFCGTPDSADWVLVDAGVMGSQSAIQRAAAARFGKDARPRAIVLTHGHFDHVGVLESLARDWDVPVYAHALEHRYLDGREAYPPPDPSVGGVMARLSPLYPRDPVDVGSRLRELPLDGSVPGMPGWRWLHTPGHTPGHVSLWREADRLLISGDAVITTRQESAYAALTQDAEMHGPPQYFTPDWAGAKTSVETLAALAPEIIVPGHGRPMRGPQMRAALNALAQDFDRIAVPPHRQTQGSAS
jgi:glyoxylase-like metal-dependent hydrolase (beta-lactamase superfamily II)